MLFTYDQYIAIGDISTYLAANYNSKKKMFGGTLVPKSAQLIAMCTDALRWGYEANPSDTTLPSVANYLIWECGRYGLQAEDILSLGGGGSLTPIPPGGLLPNPLDFIVSASSFIPTDGTTVNIPQFIGYNVDFIRNSVSQYTTAPPYDDTYFSWDRISGDFTLLASGSSLPDAQEGERFRIMPIG